MAELDLSLAARANPGLLARIRARMRPARALVELGGWSLAWLWASVLPERRRLPARARALWGLEYCKVRLRPSLGRAPDRDDAGAGASAVRLRGADR